MSTEKLSQLGSKSRVIRGIFELLASRERSVPRTDLGRLGRELREKYNLSATNKEMAELFEVFQKLGLGVYKASRKPTDPARFIWKVNSINTFREVLIAIDGAPRIKAAPASGISNANLTLRYPLRGEYIELNVPGDMTSDEAEGLSRIILSLGRPVQRFKDK